MDDGRGAQSRDLQADGSGRCAVRLAEPEPVPVLEPGPTTGGLDRGRGRGLPRPQALYWHRLCRPAFHRMKDPGP